MKWKRKVSIVREQDEIRLCLGEHWTNVAREDRYLVEAIQNGIDKEEQLKNLIMKHDQTNDIVSGLTLAKFILDYQDYLEKDHGYFEITM